MGQLWQSQLLFLKDMLEKHWLQGTSLSGHHMTMGFGPFEIPTCGLLQKGFLGRRSVPKILSLDIQLYCGGFLSVRLVCL